MGGRSSRNKGSSAEREFCKLLEQGLGISFERNLSQTRNGGYDLIGLDQLAIEIKRQETLCIKSWWEQAVEQAQKNQWPVLAFRQSRKPWTVIIPLALVAPRKGWKEETMSIDVETFIKIVKKHILEAKK